MFLFHLTFNDTFNLLVGAKLFIIAAISSYCYVYESVEITGTHTHRHTHVHMHYICEPC